MTHAYLVEIDYSVVGMIILEAEGYRFHATKPALVALHSYLFDTADQALYAILDRYGRTTETKSNLTPLVKRPSESNHLSTTKVENINLHPSENRSDTLLSHYQSIGIPAVVAALKVIAEAGQSGDTSDTEQGHAEGSEPLQRGSVAA